MNAVTQPETEAIAKETANTLTVAKDFKVVDNAGYEQAGGMLKGIMALRKKISDTFDPHVKRAFEAHRALVAEKKLHEAPLMEAESIYKRAMLSYSQEQERIRREEEAKLRAKAEAEQAEIRAKAAAAEAAAAQKAAEQRRLADEAAAAGRAAEAAKLQAKAQATETAGAEKAANLNIRADTIATPVVRSEVPKVKGISTSKIYSCKVTDLKQLAAAVGAGTVPLLAITANTTFLNTQAKAFKEAFEYPGCEIATTEQMASRSA